MERAVMIYEYGDGDDRWVVIKYVRETARKWEKSILGKNMRGGDLKEKELQKQLE